MNKKIPTVLGIGLVLVLLVVVGISVQGLGQVTKIFNFASEISTPKMVSVANITDTSFTVWWITDKEDSGTIAYGKSSGVSDGVAVDDRDMTNPGGKYKVHFVRVSGLTASTKYYFKVQPGGTVQEVMTGTKVSTQSSEPIYGKVTDGEGAVAVLKINGASDLAALVKKDGNYVLPMVNLQNGTRETIDIYADEQNLATISCIAGKDKPLPTVKIGDKVDCEASSKPIVTVTPVSTTSAGFKVPKVTGGNPQINISAGETVSTSLPTISGKAGPNQSVKIEIHSTIPRTAIVTADPAGNWTWTPPSNLEPGQHTVTITVVGADGKEQKVTREFFVTSGSPILPITSGTPSGELTHKTCINEACTTVSGLGSDSCSVDTDCVATISATPTLTPTPTTPDTGAVENTIVFIVGGVLLLLLGVILKYGTTG